MFAKMKKERDLRRFTKLVVAFFIISIFLSVSIVSEAKGKEATPIVIQMATIQECSIWSQPNSASEYRIKKIPAEYSVSVYSGVINGKDGKKYYQTIKGNYIISKYLVAGSAQKQVGMFDMYLWKNTSNGVPLYAYGTVQPEMWGEIFTYSGPVSHRTSYGFGYNLDDIEYTHPRLDDEQIIGWPQYLVDFVEEMGITPEMSDYEKAYTVGLYIGENVKYDRDFHTGCQTTKYLVEKRKAVCAGYANAYVNICHMLGIECYRQSGVNKTTGNNHAWNRVVIGGKNYYVDVTLHTGKNWTNKYLMSENANSFFSTHLLHEENDGATYDCVWGEIQMH